MRVTLFAATCLLLATPLAQADAPRTFQEAKKVAWKLYAPPVDGVLLRLQI